MEELIHYHFLKEISDHNILALTSHCNVRCKFCSHGNNPEGTRVYMSKSRSYKEVVSSLDFLDSRKKIIIGESASPVCEGEPFLVKDFRKILEAIRKKFPKTAIRVTTNGTFLTSDTIDWLCALRHISVNLSLNTVAYRKLVMGDSSDVAVKAPPLLMEAGIPFQGSIVLMPELTGWEDIENTLSYLHQNGAKLVRLLMPGYSKLAPKERHYDWDEYCRTAMALIKKQKGITLLEPPLYPGTEPTIYGVVSASPAYQIGLQKGDIICEVNGTVPKNRYDAWCLIAQKKSCELSVRRDAKALSFVLRKDKGGCGGIVFLNDLDLTRLERMASLREEYQMKYGKGAILCSAPGRPYLEANLPLFPALDGLDLVTVESGYFGGNIGAAGLLTVSDYEAAAATHDFDYAFLPKESFNSKGEDLQGISENDLSFIHRSF